jgi:metallo-beta-lactamase family protein
MHSECFDENMNRYIQNDPDPFGFNKLKYIRKVDDSKALNKKKGPCIIISASGMANAGRVKHHIVNNIGDSNSTILIAGFCAEGTLGAELVKKPDTVKIYGKDFKVNARIEVMNSLSAHGDQKEMTDFLCLQNKEKLKKIFLVHGDNLRQEVFKNHLLSEGFNSVEIPSIGNSYNI